MPDQVWEGSYYDGRTSRRSPARIRVLPSGVWFETAEGETVWWPYPGIRQTQGGLPGEHVRLEFGTEPARALVIADQTILTAIRTAAPAYRRRFHQASRRSVWTAVTIISLVLIVAVGWVTYAWIIPATADAVALRLPVAWEEKLGEAVADSLAPPVLRCADPSRLADLERILATLTRTIPDSRYRYRLAVINMRVPNAFAAPGGFIVITRGLLELADGPGELAGVLAHEIQHVERRDGTRRLIREVSFRTLVSLALGDAAGLQSVLQAARTLGSLRYQREDELVADEGAVRVLRAARVDPRVLITMFEKFKREVGDMPPALAYLSSHPNIDERISRIRRLAGPERRGGNPFKLTHPWAEIEQICR